MSSFSLGAYASSVQQRLETLDRDGAMKRLWQKDATLFGCEAGDRSAVGFMGWMDIARTLRERVAELTSFAQEVREAGFERVVLLGMGGSSLAPLVLSDALAEPGKGLPLAVLDSTHPGRVLEVERMGPVEKALFIVASKSGTTAEPVAFDDYFFDAVKRVKGDRAGENFVAITDPGTALGPSAEQRSFRKVFLNWAEIGGRFSALSYFGMVPAALMGIDVAGLLDRAIAMVEANGADVAASAAPGAQLGAAIGELARQGVDKLTLVTPGRLSSLGLWLEQLIAESTGKNERGVLPVAGERLADPSAYGPDRVFAHIHCGQSPEEQKIQALQAAGFPVIDIDMGDSLELGAEFYRWEIATAISAVALQVNPFDQPNVQESKDVTKRFLKEIEEKGALPEEQPTVVGDGLAIYGGQEAASVRAALRLFCEGADTRAYVALMAFLAETPELNAALEELQARIRDHSKAATSLGYGPRFLHSTGQYHKGGPANGLYVQFTADVAEDAALPGRCYGFAQLCSAQALGDRETLASKGRRVLRVDLGADPVAGVRKMIELL